MLRIIRNLALIFLITVWVPLAAAAVKVGQPAPLLEVTTFEGKEFALARLQGKAVILHYWATWCPACRREMPVLSRFYAKSRNRVQVLALSLDQPRDHEKAAKALGALGLPGAMLSEAKVNELGSPGTLPVTYVIDPQGIVRRIFMPGKDASETELTESSLAEAVGPGH